MRIHHVAFRTADLANLERFYVEAVGLDVVRRRSGESVWLAAGGSVLMLELKAEGEPAHPSGSNECVAFAMAPDAHALYTRLARAGVPIESSTEFTFYVRDPDGRRIGLSSYPAKLE